MVRNLAGLLFILCLVGCMGDGGVRVNGQVIGSAGAPIVGARVYLDDPGRARYPASFETTTEPDGSFTLSTTVAPGHYTIPLVVEAMGLKTARLDIQTLADNVVGAKLVETGANSDSKIVIK